MAGTDDTDGKGARHFGFRNAEFGIRIALRLRAQGRVADTGKEDDPEPKAFRIYSSFPRCRYRVHELHAAHFITATTVVWLPIFTFGNEELECPYDTVFPALSIC